MAVYGLTPRLSGAGWALLVVFLLLGELGPLLELPSWAMNLSPVMHVPRLPGGALRVVPLLWLTFLAVALTAVALTVAGLAGFRRRDIAER